jgi:hypothetical protein
MASNLQIAESITESSDASYLNITDITKPYKAFDPFQNLTGSGTPNDDIANTTYVQFQVKFPDPSSLLPQANYYVFPTGLNYLNIYVAAAYPIPAFPNVVNYPYKLLASAYGLDKFPMGIYEFLVSYGGSWGVKIYKWKIRQALIQQGCCCVKTLQSAVECGDCTDQQVTDYFNALVALTAIQSDMNCLKQNRTAEAIQRLNDICTRNGCSTCGF